MGFLDEYKKLDNLCKDTFKSEAGVTSYIKEMETSQMTRFQPESWNNDYKKLRHYRHIRNQIAHDNYATEANLCNAQDVKWIKDYCLKIINETDSLTIYSKSKNGYRLNISNKKHSKKRNYNKRYRKNNKSQVSNYFFLIMIILIGILYIFSLFQNY